MAPPQSSGLRASSGTEGFFQPTPKLENQLYEDWVLNRIFEFHLPTSIKQSITPSLSQFASHALSPHIFSLVEDAERHTPTVRTHSTFGVPKSVLHTGRGWRELQDLGIKEGIVAIASEAQYGHYARLYQFVKYHVWTASSAIVTCPSAMTDGAARLLERQLSQGVTGEQEKIFREAVERLTSRDPQRAWTSGQWMTERSGGSDIRGTETVATIATDGGGGGVDENGLPLGPYAINGFKWFSSATDADMAILLAKTDAGITAFFAPMRRRATSSTARDSTSHEVEMNGISIQRLKPKLGTRPLPTAELVLKDTRAWMIGRDGQGIREMATILNITRIHTGISALGMWGRGLAISRAFARVRKVDGGKLLMDVPAHVKALATNTVNYAAMMHLGFFTVALLGICEQPGELAAKAGHSLVASVEQATALLRLLTPVMKAQCSKLSIYGLQECMESLGGVGYLEDEQEFNVARLFRDANVLSIWEGTTDVMATDVVRVMKGREGEQVRKALNMWANNTVKRWIGQWKVAEELVRAELGRLEEMWVNLGVDELRFKGRDLLESLAWIVAAVMMVENATRDGNRPAEVVAQRWISRGEPEGRSAQHGWKEVAVLDRLVAFGHDGRIEHSRL